MSVLPDHASIQRGFHDALWQSATPAGLRAQDATDRRFSVYRNNVQHGLSSALAVKFQVIERLVGAQFFAAMARAFAAQHPPETPVLHEWGGAFPGFLESFPPVAHLPYLADVARLELARGRAYHAADAPVADPALLAVADPSGLCLRLAPSVTAYASRFPAVSIWQSNQPGARPGPVPGGAEFALIARKPDFDVLVAPLDAAQHGVLCRLREGAPLGAAAGNTDPGPLLTLLLTHSLIAAITGETP